MSPLQEPSPEMLALLATACEGSADSDEISRLESLIGRDETAIRLLLDYFRLHAELTLRFRGEAALSNALQDLEVTIGTGNGGDSMGCVGNDPGGDEPWPPSPIVALSGNAAHGAWGYFSSGWPVAYLVATVIFGLGLLIGAYVHVSQPVQVARQPLLPSRSAAEAKGQFVGRITGMVDCQWEKGSGFKVQGSGAEDLPLLPGEGPGVRAVCAMIPFIIHHSSFSIPLSSLLETSSLCRRA